MGVPSCGSSPHRDGSVTGLPPDGPSRDPLEPLVEAVRRGDRDAIAEVYLAVAPGLRGFLRRRVPHGEVADDLVEQTFLELIEDAPRLRGDATSLRAWLYRAARNNLHDWRRRAERRSDHGLRDHDAERLSVPGPTDPAELVRSPDPALEAALGELTEAQREVVELRFVADLPIAEVAAITGRTTGAVKLLQHRAVRRLAALLDGTRPEPS
jgi:RNA polymerase sigma-70 factor, ECF subfamily